MRASDRRARFVGLDAYEAAGGMVLRDLFEDDGGGWLQDVALLDRLVTEKLAAEAEKVAAEGWKWIEVAVDFRYGHANQLRRLDGAPVELTAEEQATFDALTAEYAKLESEYEGADELPDDVDARLGEIETALAAFDNRPVRYDPAEIARAGVFVSIDADGRLAVDRGYVRPRGRAVAGGTDGAGSDASDGAMRRFRPLPQSSAPSSPSAGAEAEEDEDEDDAIKPLPERLVSELTAHRTLALRDAVANNPQVAMTALLHKLCLDTFQHSRARRMPGGLGAACILPRPGDGSEGQCLGQGGRRAARSLEGRAAQGRRRALGLAHRRSTTPGALRFWRIAFRSASTLSTRRATAMAARASRCMASSSALPKRTGSRARSASTW